MKRLSIKAFLEVTLVSLTLRVHTIFLILVETQTILLYWFAAQQQTSTSRWQKLDLLYPKSSPFSLLNLVLRSKTGSGQKLLELNQFRKPPIRIQGLRVNDNHKN